MGFTIDVFNWFGNSPSNIEWLTTYVCQRFGYFFSTGFDELRWNFIKYTEAWIFKRCCYCVTSSAVVGYKNKGLREDLFGRNCIHSSCRMANINEILYLFNVFATLFGLVIMLPWPSFKFYSKFRLLLLY